MPATIILDDQVTFVTDPVNPCAGENFTVSWQEKEHRRLRLERIPGHVDLDDQGSGEDQALQCDPLPAGESALRSLTFNLAAGNYVMTLVINAQPPLDLGNVIIEECFDTASDQVTQQR